MNRLIESMESRVLFSAGATVLENEFAALKNDAATAKAELKSGLATINADARAVKSAALAAHPNTRAQKQLLITLQRDQTVGTAQFNRQINALITSGLTTGTALAATVKGLLAHPTNAALQRREAALLSKLQNLFSTQNIAAVESNVQALFSKVTTDLDTLASTLPSTSGAVITTETDLTNSMNTIAGELSAINQGITKLAGDLA